MRYENSRENFHRIDSSNGEPVNVNNLTNEIPRLEKEINGLKRKLENCHDQQRTVDIEISDVNRLRREALLELEHASLGTADMQNRLPEIRGRYKKMNKFVGLGEAAAKRIVELTGKKFALRQELLELRRIQEEEGNNLAEINETIARRKKLNTALMRKIRRGLEDRKVSEQLVDKANALLNDFRGTEGHVEGNDEKRLRIR